MLAIMHILVRTCLKNQAKNLGTLHRMHDERLASLFRERLQQFCNLQNACVAEGGKLLGILERCPSSQLILEAPASARPSRGPYLLHHHRGPSETRVMELFTCGCSKFLQEPIQILTITAQLQYGLHGVHSQELYSHCLAVRSCWPWLPAACEPDAYGLVNRRRVTLVVVEGFRGFGFRVQVRSIPPIVIAP